MVYGNKPVAPPPSSLQRPVAGKAQPKPAAPTRPVRASASPPKPSLPAPSAREPVTDELYIRRLPVDEALFRLDAYLDAAFMAGYFSVRIVHGKGGGILKGAVWQRLKEHPLVHSYRLAEIGEGDAGVTVAELVRK
ncbi:MAG: Smr/MutS family protein [Chloroflexi bacterium]|nr:Smr/MutS family protein [Chloroflexota bacterium]